MSDAGKTPETPRWEYDDEERFYVKDGVEQTTSDVLEHLTHLEGALREAEAKAALTLKYARHLDNCEVFASFMVSEGQVGFDCSCGYDALQQPKAGSS